MTKLHLATALAISVMALLSLPTQAATKNTPAKISYTTVEAPESPYNFQPLKMFVFPEKFFPITKYGAKQGNIEATTKAFAKAMEACNKAGGGHVVVPEGEWLTGPIHFRSNCDLRLSEGSKLVFEDDVKLYFPAVQVSWEGAECMNISPLLYAFGCENIGISGPGTIAPKMDFWRTWFTRPDSHMQATRQLYAMMSTGVPVENRRMEADGVRMRPHLIHFNRCRNIQFNGFKIRESPFWTIHTFLCTDVWAHELDVYAHGHNNDGIDIEMTQHVLVENCQFDQGDDAVVIKSGRNQDAWKLATPTADVVVRNCNIVSGHCLLGIGSEISGGVSRIYLHDCKSTSSVYRLFYIKTNHRRGGVIEDITVENVAATNMYRMFEIGTDVLYQWRTIVPTFETRLTKIRNITFRNATAENADAIYEIRGDQRDPVRNITLENLHAKNLHRFENYTEHVSDIHTKDISWDNFDDSVVSVPGFTSVI